MNGTSKVLALAMGAACMLLAPEARAQVNTERLRMDLQKRPVFASFNGSMNSQLGNVESVLVGAGVFVGATTRQNLAFLRAQLDYGTFQGAPTVSKSFAHVRYNLILTDFLAAEALTQAQTDAFRRLTRRLLVGVGPRFTPVAKGWLEVHVGSLYLLESELLTPVDLDPVAHDDVWHRWSNYVAVDVSLDERFDISSVTYVQPRFDAWSDFRLLHETLLSVSLAKHLAAKVGVTVRFDNAPPVDVKGADLEVRNSLEVRF